MNDTTRPEVDDELTQLPAPLAKLVSIVGFAGAIDLVNAYGGIRLYIPERLSEDHPLMLLLGSDGASRLVAAYCGEQIEIPRPDRWYRHMIWRHMMAHRRAGMSQSKVARMYGYAVRSVRRVERKWESRDTELPPEVRNDDQMDLF